MSKIIIHNETEVADDVAMIRVLQVIERGFISGERQYCWATSFPDCVVESAQNRKNSNTHTFKLVDW